MKNQIREMQ